MIGRPTVVQLDARVSRLESGHGPLTVRERAELLALDTWRDQAFAGPIATWSNETLEEYFRHASGRDGVAQRHAELRRRDQSPERKAADHRRLAEHLGIDPSEVEADLARALAELDGDGTCRN